MELMAAKRIVLLLAKIIMRIAEGNLKLGPWLIIEVVDHRA